MPLRALRAEEGRLGVTGGARPSPADGGGVGNAYGQGVLECALGIVNKDEKFRGIFEFCIWYEQLLRREGHDTDESPL